METIVTMLWLGGLVPAYRAARANGYKVFGSVTSAIIWPADVGWHLAEAYCKDDKP